MRLTHGVVTRGGVDMNAPGQVQVVVDIHRGAPVLVRVTQGLQYLVYPTGVAPAGLVEREVDRGRHVARVVPLAPDHYQHRLGVPTGTVKCVNSHVSTVTTFSRDIYAKLKLQKWQSFSPVDLCCSMALLLLIPFPSNSHTPTPYRYTPWCTPLLPDEWLVFGFEGVVYVPRTHSQTPTPYRYPPWCAPLLPDEWLVIGFGAVVYDTHLGVHHSSLMNGWLLGLEQ